jgi:peptidoglycan/xylan/chitin deacetylase (PgdA/CDA1 family)
MKRVGEQILKIRYLVFLVLQVVFVSSCQGGDNPDTAAQATPAAIKPDTKLVSLFFDDAFLNQYEKALPVLKEYNYRATFAVITDSVGKGHDLWEYMDKKHLEDLAASGMDIANHTRTHAKLTDNLTDEKLRKEIFESKSILEKMGFKVSTMVYPYYEYNERVIEQVAQAGYTCARAGWSQEKACRINAADPKARYHVFSWQITNQDMDTFKTYLEESGPNTVVGLTYHFITDNGPAATSTPEANYKAQMAYLKEGGYTVVPLPQLFKQ